jgi:hypothetical protein
MNATGATITRLMEEREIPGTFSGTWAIETAFYAKYGMYGFPCGGELAAKLIARLESFPVRPDYVPTVETLEGIVKPEVVYERPALTASAPAIQSRGMYRLNGDIYKVIENPRTGRYAAHKLNTETRKYSYAKGVIYRLTDAHRLELETVAAHGLDQLWCLCCGRNLDRKESQERGIGPICAEKYGY